MKVVLCCILLLKADYIVVVAQLLSLREESVSDLYLIGNQVVAVSCFKDAHRFYSLTRLKLGQSLLKNVEDLFFTIVKYLLVDAAFQVEFVQFAIQLVYHRVLGYASKINRLKRREKLGTHFDLFIYLHDIAV